jgi:integrase
MLTTRTTSAIAVATDLARFRRRTHADNTLINYAYRWGRFSRWCADSGKASLPSDAETVILFVAYLLALGRTVGTAGDHVSAIVFKHRECGHAAPIDSEVKAVLAGARYELPHDPRRMKPFTLAQIKAMCVELKADGSDCAIRNRALVLMGFASGMRASSLCSLHVEDVTRSPAGLDVAIRKEKQNRTGRPRHIGIAAGKHPSTCPVRCLDDWMKRGAGELLIAEQTGHKSMPILRGYIRRGNLFRANASTFLGL